MEQKQGGVLAQPEGGCLSAEWIRWFGSPKAAAGIDLQERQGTSVDSGGARANCPRCSSSSTLFVSG